MRSLILFLALISSILLLSQSLVTIKKGAPVATSVECWKKMNQAVVDNDIAYFENLKKELCYVVLSKDIKVYLIDNSKGMAILRIPGKSTRLYVNSSLVKY